MKLVIEGSHGAYHREDLAEPVGDTIFFAGEATHHAVNPCLQAAAETGRRAATQVLEACRQCGNCKL